MEFSLITALIFVILAAANATTTANHENGAGITVRMPRVRPTRPDSYLCAALKLGDAPIQVIGYEPLIDRHTVHHMNIFACETPGSDAPVWHCGLMGERLAATTPGGMPSGPKCASGLRHLIYAWANAAPPLRLPDGVGLKVPAYTTLVLQVHYASIDKFLQRWARR